MQFLLGPLALGDVLGNAQQVRGAAVAVVKGDFEGMQDQPAAGRVVEGFRGDIDDLSRADGVQIMLSKQVGLFAAVDIVVRFTDHSAFLKPKHLVRFVVPEFEAEIVLGILYEHGHGQVLNQVVQEVLLLLKPFLGSFARRDVPRGAEGANDGAILVAQTFLGGEDPGDRSVGPGLLFLAVDEWFAGAHDVLLVGGGGLRVGGEEEIEVGFAEGRSRVGQFEYGGHGLVDAKEAALPILKIDMVGHVIHEAVHQVAFLGQGFVGPLSFADFADQVLVGLGERGSPLHHQLLNPIGPAHGAE